MRFMSRILLSLSLIGVVRCAKAQSNLDVHGEIVDPTGAGVAGARVQLQSTSGSALRDSITDASGHFVIVGLAKGNYSIVVPAYSGFAATSLPLRIFGDNPVLTIKLSTESVRQEVTVGDDRQLSAADAAENRDAIATTGAQLRKLPVFDQDYIAALTPFLDAGSGSSGGATIIVDGVEMKHAGVSASAIQEVRVNNDPYAAEFTRPGRGRIEITTKPGSPHFHGEANFTDRDAIFNAKNHFSPNRPTESRLIFEGHLSGPIGRNHHTSFIASAEYRRQDTAAVVNAIGLDGPVSANVPTPNRDSEYSLRINHDFSADHRLSVGYNFEGNKSIDENVGGIVLAEAGYNVVGREDDLILNDRLIVTPHLINQLQVTLEKDEEVTTSVTAAPSIQVGGFFIGGGAQADVARTENTIHVNEVVSWSHGKHYIRAGVQLPQFSRRAIDDQSNRLGTFKFASLDAYTANTPLVFNAQQGPGRGLYWINEFGSFIQDQVRFSARLQASFGLRYDWQTFLHDDNNFAPRVSFAYSPAGGKTILRLGSGVFYDRTGGVFPGTVVVHNGVVLHSVQIQKPSYPDPGADFSTIPTNLVRFASNLRSPYSVQYSFGVERQIRKGATVTAAYRGQVQVKSFRSRDANAPLLPPDPSPTISYSRPNPNLGQVQQIESGGRSLQNALDLSFRGQAGRWFSGQAQYTFARLENNTGGIGAFPQDQYRPNAEWGRADQDRRQRFNLIGNINPEHWLSLGVNATLYSGLPFTETTGNDDFQTGLVNARPFGVSRNTLQTGGVASLDLLYDHDFFMTRSHDEGAPALSAGISAFNVLNRTNYVNYVGEQNSSRFGTPTAALAGRQLQFSLGYRF